MKRRRQPRLSLREQVLEALVGLARRAEARELAHGPETPTITGRMNPAGVRELAGIGDLMEVLVGRRERCGQRVHFHRADGGVVVLPVRLLLEDGTEDIAPPGRLFLLDARDGFAGEE